MIEPDISKPALNTENEVPFSFDEIFFSRTDPRGIILAGNTVFQRISQYSWEELIKRPHNIIRHPDMPKGVFYLLWHVIKQGKPIGAYVKNRAKDGRYYWVFALVTPVQDGYLSVRIKPSSEFFPIVEDAYKALLAYERANKPTPEESMVYLLGMLKTLGFDSYDSFMSVAIRKEIASRDKNLGLQDRNFLARFEEITECTSALITETASIFSAYEENQYVPMNLQIQSARLGEEGKTIGVISGNFSVVSSEIQNELNLFNQSAQDVFTKIYAGQFLLCTACIQKEVVEFWQKESADSGTDNSQEMAMLLRQMEEYQQRASDGLKEIICKIDQFQEDCRRLKKCAASLEVIRVMGKIDAARLHSAPSGLNELIDELGKFQLSISQSLSKIEQHNASMRFDADSVITSLAS